jgi:hypothetical protein
MERFLNLMQDSLARAVIAARLEDSDQRRLGRRLVCARRMRRKADRASARAQRLRQLAAQAERRARVAHTSTA